MCEKCDQNDNRIGQLKTMAVLVADKRVLDAIDKEIAKLEAEKIELHPEQNK